MSTISSETIDQIKQSWRTVLKNYTGYAKKNVNGELSFICPICGNGSGSNGDGLTFIPEYPTVLNCFKCNEKGDIFHFIAKAENLDEKKDFVKIVEKCASLAGITIEYGKSEHREKTKNTEIQSCPDIKTNDDTYSSQQIKEWHDNFNKSNELCDMAMDYLSSRHIFKFAENENIGCAYIDNRPCITIAYDKDNVEVRFIDGNSKSRYRKLKGSHAAIFNSEVLYKDNDSEPVFVCEGVFDGAGLEMIGYDFIALGSASNTKQLVNQINIMPTYRPLIICFDNKEVEPQSMKKAIELEEELKKVDENIQVCVYDISTQCKIKADGTPEKDLNDIVQRENYEGLIALVKDAKDVLAKSTKDNFDKFIEDTANPNNEETHETGINFIKRLLGGGIDNQKLYILMAPPATGKTALAQQIGESLADNGTDVIYINLEMSVKQMYSRAISYRIQRDKQSGFTAEQIRKRGKLLTNEQNSIIEEAMRTYKKNAHKHIKYNPDSVTTDLDNIRAYLKNIGERSIKRGIAAPVVVIDYLHLITSSNSADRIDLISKAIIALKNEYAIKYNTAVLAIAAVNRNSYDIRTTLSSGRDTSSIEFTADVIIGMNYTVVDDGKTDIKQAELDKEMSKKYRNITLRVTKNRDGMAGNSEKVYYYAACNIFYGSKIGEYPVDVTYDDRTNPDY